MVILSGGFINANNLMGLTDNMSICGTLLNHSNVYSLNKRIKQSGIFSSLCLCMLVFGRAKYMSLSK